MQLFELRGSGRQEGADRAFRWLTIGAAALVLVILGLVAITMTRRSVPVLREMGLDFFVSTRWSEADHQFGALAFVFGTLYTATIAILLAVPISLGVALFITQGFCLSTSS